MLRKIKQKKKQVFRKFRSIFVCCFLFGYTFPKNGDFPCVFVRGKQFALSFPLERSLFLLSFRPFSHFTLNRCVWIILCVDYSHNQSLCRVFTRKFKTQTHLHRVLHGTVFQLNMVGKQIESHLCARFERCRLCRVAESRRRRFHFLWFCVNLNFFGTFLWIFI